jgi:hypothetical protein
MSIKKSVVGFFLIFALFLLFGGAALHECKAGQAAGTSPVYRFFNTQTGTHFFTISEAEKNNIIATLPHFTFEGVAWYCFPPGPPPPPPPNGGSMQWGVLTDYYCTDSSPFTFSGEIDGTTKTSTTHGAMLGSWNGYASTSSGSKNFSYSLVGCGINDSGTISDVPPLEADKCYLFFLTYEEPDLVLVLAEIPGCVDPRTLLDISFEESSGAIDLSDFFDDKLEIIEEYELNSIE